MPVILEIAQLSELVSKEPAKYVKLPKPKIVRCNLEKGITTIGIGYGNASWIRKELDTISRRKDIFVDRFNQYIGFFRFPGKGSLGSINFNGIQLSYTNFMKFGTCLYRKKAHTYINSGENIIIRPEDTLSFGHKYVKPDFNFSITVKEKN